MDDLTYRYDGVFSRESPIFPGKRYDDWDVADPKGQPIEAVRAIRDGIQARVTTLLGQVLHHS